MNPAWLGSLGGGGDCQWGDATEIPWEGRSRSQPEIARRGNRRRKTREPYELSPESLSSQRRIHRDNQRQRSLHMARTLTSVTSLTPSCGPELLLTKYQRLSQLVRYTAFLEDATSALVRELGVRLNFDFSPVTRHIRRLRYQVQTRGAVDFPAEEADEVMKLLDTMSAGNGEQQQQQKVWTTTTGSWNHRNAASTAAAQPVQPPQLKVDDVSADTCILPR